MRYVFVSETPEAQSVPQSTDVSKTAGKGRGKKVAAKQSKPSETVITPGPDEPPTPVKGMYAY